MTTKQHLVSLLSEGRVREFNLFRLRHSDEKIDLSGANLRRANLSGADLYDADLRGVDFRGADMRLTDLSMAKLEGANLCWVDLRGAKGLRLEIQEEYIRRLRQSWQ